MQKWVQDFQIVEGLAILHIFGEQVPAVRRLCSSDNQGIPPGSLIFVLYRPGPYKEVRIGGYGFPTQEIPDILSGAVLRQLGIKSLRDSSVKPLKNVNA